jgi:lysophospholipid acyltransferase (LPLAT)-like uncharacterized protein
MSVTKRLLKYPRVISLLSYILASYMYLTYASSRKEVLMDDDSLPYMQGKDNAIFAFWHGRMMMMPSIHPRQRPFHVLISHHRDGMLISKVVEHFRVGTVSGSSSRGGGTAMRTMLQLLEEGGSIGITPDGPRGPNQTVASAGVVSLAKLSQKPIIPVAFSASRCIRLGSWDRFMLVRPFGKLVFCVGAPIAVPADATEAQEQVWCDEVEHMLNKLAEIADGAVA